MRDARCAIRNCARLRPCNWQLAMGVVASSCLLRIAHCALARRVVVPSCASLIAHRPFCPSCASDRDLPTYGVYAHEGLMGSLVKKRRKKMSKHKYRKRLRADRHKKNK